MVQAQTDYIPDPTGYGGTTIEKTGNGQGTVTEANAQTGTVSATKGAVPEDFCTTASTCISSVVYIFTVGLMSIFAYIGSYLFDFAIQIALNSTSYALDFLTSGWTAVRDIANMAFVFILIYIAFTIIFEADTHGTMKTLAGVVIMALLINFSFFLTRVVIDAGNILAVQFYNAIPAPTLAEQAQKNGFGSAAGISAALSRSGYTNTKDLTASIMDAVKVQTLLSSESFQKYSEQQGSGVGVFLTNLITQILIYIAVAAILAMLGFAFLAVGFKFLMRLVVLWFLIISAPLAFAMRALSNSRKAVGLYHQWQDTLIQFSFYPAIFLFMFFIMSGIMRTIGGNNGIVPGIFKDLTGSGLTGTGALAAAIANVGIRLGFVIIMLYFGLKVADMVVKTGSEMAKGFAERVTGATAAGGAIFGRNTVGYAGNSIARSDALRKAAARPGLGGLLAGGLQGVATKASKNSFDLRGAPGSSLIQKRLGLSLGKAQKGGYVDRSDAAAHKKEAQGKALEPTAREKDEARAQAEEQIKTQERKAEQETKIKQAEQDRKEIGRRIETLKNAPKQPQTGSGPTPAGQTGQRIVPSVAAQPGHTQTGQSAPEQPAKEIEKPIQNSLERAQREQKIQNIRIKAAKLRQRLIEKETVARAKEISGEGASKVFAKTLITPNIRNAGMIFRSSKEAAAHLFHGKSTKDQATEAFKKLMKEEEAKEAHGDAHAPEGGEKKAEGGEHKPEGGGETHH